MMFNYVEIIGIAASFIILISMSFKSLSLKGNIMMRIFNLIGSIVFVVYGMILPAYSTAFLNIAVSIINIYHLVKMVKQYHKDS